MPLSRYHLRASIAVSDIERAVGFHEGALVASGVDFIRYERVEHDPRGITPRAGGGRIAWFQDPDGNTLALEADA
ncbi:hypothetical protein LADH09A_003154 [Micromonospora sp. LAH09]|uniref:VOC family protein n=1 Tax=Micromonospora cabrerizensis TaxID=2911213 RepID=UPI001EE7C5F5|nr:hypothetical protein [Micromonospora cabrerizensis]MCG5469246.1 hypothetical protein [Micromonospora cabrerizensis]